MSVILESRHTHPAFHLSFTLVRQCHVAVMTISSTVTACEISITQLCQFKKMKTCQRHVGIGLMRARLRDSPEDRKRKRADIFLAELKI